MPKTFQMSRSFAIHEVGKALVATVMRLDRERQGLKRRLERVERVSMVPRGRCVIFAQEGFTVSQNSPASSACVSVMRAACGELFLLGCILWQVGNPPPALQSLPLFFCYLNLCVSLRAACSVLLLKWLHLRFSCMQWPCNLAALIVAQRLQAYSSSVPTIQSRVTNDLSNA